MTQYKKFPLPLLIALTTLPALMVGMALWFIADTYPDCSITEKSRLTAPDGAFDLVTFSRSCGDSTPVNTQAALVPPGETVPEDAASFLSVGLAIEFAPQWTGDKTLSISVPADAPLFRQDDTVADVAVTYH